MIIAVLSISGFSIYDGLGKMGVVQSGLIFSLGQLQLDSLST